MLILRRIQKFTWETQGHSEPRLPQNLVFGSLACGFPLNATVKKQMARTLLPKMIVTSNAMLLAHKEFTHMDLITGQLLLGVSPVGVRF